MRESHYIARATRKEKELVQTLLKKYKNRNPRLNVTDIEILIAALKTLNINQQIKF